MSVWGGNSPHCNFSAVEALTSMTISVNALSCPPMKIRWYRLWLANPKQNKAKPNKHYIQWNTHSEIVLEG